MLNQKLSWFNASYGMQFEGCPYTVYVNVFKPISIYHAYHAMLINDHKPAAYRTCEKVKQSNFI